MKSSLKTPSLILLAIAFIAGLAVDRLWQNRVNDDLTSTQTTSRTEIEATATPATQNYICPMHAHIQSHEKGHCPVCGMDLVPARNIRHAETSNDDRWPAVTISSRVINNLGVRTARVERGTLPRRIDTMGLIGKIGTTRNTDIKPGIPGRLESMTDKQAGEIVQAGEFLYSVFSPERIRAQEEYLESWRAKDHAMLPTLWDALRKLHFSDVDIKQLEDTQKIERLYNVTAPHQGAIIQRRGVPGSRLNPVSRVFTLGGYYSLSVTAEIFERQWSWIKPRQRATMTIASIPGEKFEGVVEKINNSINFKTRTLPVGLRFNTLNPMIMTSMVVDVSIDTLQKDNVLTVPRDALIRTGKDGARVIVNLGAGRYQPLAVEIGLESDGRIEIISGLDEGDEVVVSGQFLIDSESSLTASFRRMRGQ